MIVGQEVMEQTDLSKFCWGLTDKGGFSTDMCGCIFHLFSVWYNFCSAVLKLPVVWRGQQFEKYCFKSWGGDYVRRKIARLNMEEHEQEDESLLGYSAM
jgi:hypothetical protein